MRSFRGRLLTGCGTGRSRSSMAGDRSNGARRYIYSADGRDCSPRPRRRGEARGLVHANSETAWLNGGVHARGGHRVVRFPLPPHTGKKKKKKYRANVAADSVLLDYRSVSSRNAVVVRTGHGYRPRSSPRPRNHHYNITWTVEQQCEIWEYHTVIRVPR